MEGPRTVGCEMKRTTLLAIALTIIGLGSLFVGFAYVAYNAASKPYAAWQRNQQGMMGQWSQQPQTSSNTPVTMDQAETIAQQYLQSLNNPNLAIKEIMEFQYNFYIIYYEKDTGIGAFEMLIWKQAPPSGMMGSGMMGSGSGRATGYIMPEPGPNMMWNTKYSQMGNNMMGQGMMGNQYLASTQMRITTEQALQIAQSYLDSNIQNAKVEDATQFYGYYTIDFTVNGKIAGMLSVNGQTGQAWYHTWHGAFLQEVEFD